MTKKEHKMSGTSVISEPTRVNNIKINGLSSYKEMTDDDLTNTNCETSTRKAVVKPSNHKENKKSGCYYPVISKINRSKKRVISETELKVLFATELYSSEHESIDNVELLKRGMKHWDQYYSFPRLFLTNETDESKQDPFVLQPSLFHLNNVPPTIYFATRTNDESKPPVGLPKRLHSLFRWKISTITPNSIRNCISFMKFETIKPSNTIDVSYLGSWCKHMKTPEFANLDYWRKVNHYPGSFHMGRKDKLWLRLRLATQKYKYESFHPQTFVLPRDYDELREFWQNSPSNLFIIKPPASARGNGIRVINHISQIPENVTKLQMSPDGEPVKKPTMIVQQYISNPCLLENSQKFDLRVYVLVTSVDPLRVYVCEEGLVRFASSKYSSQESGIIDQYMHLTNYFVNKNNQEYQINNDCDSLHGNKWTLKRFWRYLADHHHQHINVQKLWDEIVDIIIKTVICCEGPMARLSNQHCKNDYTSYELFGFDIILDQDFKPWILEVNITPSLKSESRLDTSVKFNVIKDMFNLVGYHLPPPFNDDELLSDDVFGDCRLFFDRRLYDEKLSETDILKQLKFLKSFKVERGLAMRSGQLATFEDATDKQESCDPSCNRPSSQVPSSTDPVNNEDENVQSSKSVNSESYSGNDDDHGADDHEERANDRQQGWSCGILDDLTDSDVRVLMLAEDELSRCGQFKRVFPSPTSSKYLKYFDKPRYYNLLLDAWEQRYFDNRIEGIKRLSSLAKFLS